ncbi:transposase [Catenulispora sp. GP43]|uniref:IS630 family transposase n=1 Tax=Catenulispora sp. GP43 TaxID=3156263 RepID=UPI00351632CB
MAVPQAVPIVLDEATHRRLAKLAASRTASAADGATNAAIAAVVGADTGTVRMWRGRFAEHGLAGLADAERPGRPGRLGQTERVAVVAVATSAPPGPEAIWSHRLIAQRLAAAENITVSASQVGRILAEADLKPHKVRGWLTRGDDPAFWERAADICDLYLNPPAQAVRLSIDEKTAIAARSRKHPAVPAVPGQPARREFEYVRHGIASLVAAFDIDTGQALTEIIARNDADTFIAFLCCLDQLIAPGRDIHAVLDNGSSHVAKKTKAWLAAHPRWHVHWTPPHASWLNQVELYFSALTRAVIRHGDFTSRDDLIDKIETYVIAKNDTAKPYRWTYDGTPLKAA